MSQRAVVPGPGTVRVGRFIGRLGVVSLPAVEVGLDLDQRVVRRHVAKLEAAGWLVRAAVDLGRGIRRVAHRRRHRRRGARRRSPGQVAACGDHDRARRARRLVGRARRARGRAWKSARELAVERDRWAVTARCERGYTELLPDLAVWLERSGRPVAVIAESGGRREDRQKMILEGWRDGIVSGRYAAVRYDCANEAVEHWIRRLARKVGLTGWGSPQPYS